MTEKNPKKSGMKRRDFLKSAAAVAGAAVLGPNVIGCGDAGETSLAPVRGDGSSPLHYIENVVILQMENRSFDHYFASLIIDEGRTDIIGADSTFYNETSDRSARIYAQWIDEHYEIDPDPPHNFGSNNRQWNLGMNDGFVREWEATLAGAELQPKEYDSKLGLVMGYYKREQLPALYTLADHFTLADQWYCSMLGPTWPNRKYSHAATSEGTRNNRGELYARTPYREMKEKGLTVKTYASLPFFHFGIIVQDLNVGLADTMDDFFRDAAQGTLPNVSIVEPDYSLNDDHPPQDIRLGQSFIASVYEALRQSPQWERSLMLVFYDEHGGFFDSQPPPTVEGEELAADGFDQLGFRVPGLLIGPLVKRGHVFSEVVDHSSVPALLSRIFELEQVNERAALAGDLSLALDIELIEHSKRPEAPALTAIDVRHSSIRHALNQPFGQPELLAHARRKYGVDLPPYAERLRAAEAFYGTLENRRVARIIGN